MLKTLLLKNYMATIGKIIIIASLDSVNPTFDSQVNIGAIRGVQSSTIKNTGKLFEKLLSIAMVQFVI